MFKNTVGLEAEYFVRNKDGELVIPSLYGLETDEYAILGEFRGEPGTTREDVLANFIKEFYKTKYRVEKLGLIMDLTGWAELDTELHAKVLRTMGTKVITESKNVYDTDILEMSDAIVKRGSIVGYNASTGLHVHFSSSDSSEHSREIEKPTYSPVVIPIGIADARTTLQLYRLVDKESVVKVTAKAVANRITVPVIEYIVRQMDELLPNYKFPVKLKYRQPGFYEKKYHGGFEYRSLPFYTKTLTDLPGIVDYAFTLLKEL